MWFKGLPFYHLNADGPRFAFWKGSHETSHKGDPEFHFYAFGEKFGGITTHPKNPWTLQWRGLNLYSRGPGPQNSHFWGVRILMAGGFEKNRLDYVVRFWIDAWYIHCLDTVYSRIHRPRNNMTLALVGRLVLFWRIDFQKWRPWLSSRDVMGPADLLHSGK